MEREEAYLKEFIEESRLAGKRTPAPALCCRIRKLFRYLEEKGLRLEEVGYKEALGYRLSLEEGTSATSHPYAAGSILNFMKKALVFYEFLKQRGLVATNPFLELERVKVKREIPKRIYKEHEMERLLEALSHFEEGAGDFNHLVCRYRTHLVAELMYASGLRISEVAEVKEEELDLERGVIEVPCGKGGKRRTVFLNTYTASLLRIYVGEVRPLLRRAYHKAGTLFGSGGQRLLATTNALLKEKAAELKLPPLKSHGFRHALGTHLLRAGCDLRYIQAILGHLDIQSTEIYTKVEREDLVAILAKYHPRQLRRESIKA